MPVHIGKILDKLIATAGKTFDEKEVTEVEQKFEDGTRITLKIEKIENGFILTKETFTPLPKEKKQADLTDDDFSNQHKTAKFYVKDDPRKGEESEEFFNDFLGDSGITAAG